MMTSGRRSSVAAFVVALVLAMALRIPAAAQHTNPPAAAGRPQVDLNAILKRLIEFDQAGNYSAALIEAQKFEAGVKAQFGTNHTNYAVALNNLANVYRSQGKYAEA